MKEQRVWATSFQAITRRDGHLRARTFVALTASLSMTIGGVAVAQDTQAEASAHLLENATISAPADGGSLALDSLTSFDPTGGSAAISSGTADEEIISYSGIEEEKKLLVGVNRPDPSAHAAGDPVIPLSSPESAPSPQPSESTSPSPPSTPAPSTSPEATNSDPTASSSGSSESDESPPGDESNSPGTPGSSDGSDDQTDSTLVNAAAGICESGTVCGTVMDNINILCDNVTTCAELMDSVESVIDQLDAAPCDPEGVAAECREQIDEVIDALVNNVPPLLAPCDLDSADQTCPEYLSDVLESVVELVSPLPNVCDPEGVGQTCDEFVQEFVESMNLCSVFADCTPAPELDLAVDSAGFEVRIPGQEIIGGGASNSRVVSVTMAPVGLPSAAFECRMALGNRWGYRYQQISGVAYRLRWSISAGTQCSEPMEYLAVDAYVLRNGNRWFNPVPDTCDAANGQVCRVVAAQGLGRCGWSCNGAYDAESVHILELPLGWFFLEVPEECVQYDLRTIKCELVAKTRFIPGA